MSQHDHDAEERFAEFLRRIEEGEELDLDQLIEAEEARLRPRLRVLLEEHRRAEADLRREQDPSIELEGEGPDDFNSILLSRLSSRTPSSGRYHLQGEVARGGMGAVLRVWDEDLRRHLAMKVLLGRGEVPESGGTPSVHKHELARFLEEAQVTGQLDHPGIVPVHELGLDAQGRVFFTMKLVKGNTLGGVFDELASGEGGWTQARVLGLIQRVCEAMSYAHAKGVIHRDLKPANVMVGRFGEVFVMDWGLARILDQRDERDIRIRPEPDSTQVMSGRRERAKEAPDSPLYTMDGDVVGTPAYMPPEQAAGRIGEMGPASDVYAAGALLYHLLSGQRPYVPPGARVSPRAVLARVLEGPPRPLHQLAPKAPAELVAICEKAMARRSEDRYSDMQALAADLAAFVEGRVVRAYETGAWAEARKWVQRNRGMAASLAAAITLLVAGLLTAVLLRQEAVARTVEVLRLSALQDYDELIAEADRLWPPHPEIINAYRSWISEAERLVGDLDLHRAKREELRQHALPQTDEEREADRLSHPEFDRIADLEGEIGARRAALLQRRDGVEAELPNLAGFDLPPNASGMLELASSLVALDRKSFGRETEGLVLARRALEQAEGTGDDSLVARAEHVLSLALFALGRDEEALVASRTALAVAPEAEQDAYHTQVAELERRVREVGSCSPPRNPDHPHR